MTPVVAEFGPRRLPIWMVRIWGGLTCAAGAAMLGQAALYPQDRWVDGVLLIFGVCAAAFGATLLAYAARLAKLRAVFWPGALEVVARLWFQNGVTAARIPWADVEGFADITSIHPFRRRGVETFCVLYTRQGDFTFDDHDWQNLAGFRREIAARVERVPCGRTSERWAAQSGFPSARARMRSLERRAGWSVAVISGPLFVAAVIAGVLRGFSIDLFRGLLFLLFAFSLGISMVRFYRHIPNVAARRREAAGRIRDGNI